MPDHHHEPLPIVEWASATITEMATHLSVPHDRLPTSMAHAPGASGEGQVSNGDLGVDMIQVAAGTGFEPHTHPGDHILIVVAGEGTITYGGAIHPTRAGQVYMVDGSIPHAVGAITDHVILAVGAPHKPVDADDRMEPVEYQAIAAEFGTVHCLICDVQQAGTEIHDTGCPHCPCVACVTPRPENHPANR